MGALGAGPRDSADASPKEAKALKTFPKSTVTRLGVTADGAAVVLGAEDASCIPDDCLARSKLLEEVLGSADTSEEATLPVSTNSFLAWVQYVKADSCHGAAVEPGPGSQQHCSADETRPLANGTPLQNPRRVQNAEELCAIFQVRLLQFRPSYWQYWLGIDQRRCTEVHVL